MGAIDIRFDAVAVAPGGPVHIVFGAAPVPPDGYVDPDVATVAALGLPVVDNWQDGKAQAATILQAHTAGTRRHQATTQRFDAGSRIADDVQIEAQQGLRCANSAIDIDMQAARCSSRWIDNDEVGQRIGAPWRIAQRLLARASAGWLPAWSAARRVSALRVDAGQAGIRRAQGVRAPWASAQRAVRPLTSVWQAARRPPLGRWDLPVIPPPQPGCYTPPHGIVNILFDERAGLSFDILFSCPHGADSGPVVIPIRSTYIVINSVTLIRLPDNTALQAYSLSLKWDADSWSVGWSASLPGSALDAVMPSGLGDPVELLATINGTAVRLLAESIARDRRFGDARLNVGGRGRVAWLAAPYAPTVARAASSAMTSQQLAADALTDNGVPIGWGLDWQISDWIVPGGVWSHQGTMIDAVKRIAEAAGGYVLGHRTAQTLHVRPRYPLLPWEWAGATPDIVIPSAVASTEAITWSESPAYNRIFVAGQEQGRMGQITRAGTAGDLVAPMVTDPLITHADAARARGASILAAGGRQATVALRLPVLPATGILDIGQLVEYQDGATARRGLVRAVSVEAGLPNVWQTVEIETHA